MAGTGAWLSLAMGLLVLAGIAWALIHAGEAARVPVRATVRPGWYADPRDPARLRFFDGSGWTGRTTRVLGRR